MHIQHNPLLELYVLRPTWREKSLNVRENNRLFCNLSQTYLRDSSLFTRGGRRFSGRDTYFWQPRKSKYPGPLINNEPSLTVPINSDGL